MTNRTTIVRRTLEVIAACAVVAILGNMASSALAVNPPVITDFSPSGGFPGTVVTINGMHFAKTTAVTFNGSSATFNVVSQTQVKATVPAGATTGLIDVVTPYGTAESPSAFVVGAINHVVVIYQENQSFDSVLGKFCWKVSQGQIPHDPCDGAIRGKLPDDTMIDLMQAPDIVPEVSHSVSAQKIAINHGAMNGFANLKGCMASDTPAYRCYAQYDPSQIPNLAALAESFALSDRTFESNRAASWPSHMQLAASQLDGYYGDDPKPSKFHKPAPGGGCDSFKDAPWLPPDQTKPIMVPSCVPDQMGQGPYRPSPVQYIPTIMDRLDAAQMSWKLYNVNGPNDKTPGTGYEWATCPTFYECLNTSQKDHWVPSSDVIADAQAGNLPAYATVVPTAANSQHNNDSMAVGDNWIGSVVNAIENGPDWASTVIFITYDDCGCFYDHVKTPITPRKVGIRIPMVIVSPFARPGFTDSQMASTDSILAFVEHTFGLAPLSQNDATAYDFSNSFNVSQAPLKPVPMIQSRVPPSSVRWLREHPPKDDVT